MVVNDMNPSHPNYTPRIRTGNKPGTHFKTRSQLKGGRNVLEDFKTYVKLPNGQIMRRENLE